MKQITICVEGIKIVSRTPHPVVKVIKLDEEPNYLNDIFIPRILSSGYKHDDGKGTVTHYPARSIVSVEVKEVKDKDGE